jgi:acyl carrier protein
MAIQTKDIKAAVRSYILSTFLPGENPDDLENDTPLISGGILDSISTVKLVAFLEDEFGVRFEAYEMNADYLDTVDMIAATVEEKGAGPQ